MIVFDFVIKVVSLMSNSLNILEKIHKHLESKKKDPSGLTASDGSCDSSNEE
jgi:hypothetical protein